jgi:GntR family transcriptional regulator, uxu operon transcriptional repressor
MPIQAVDNDRLYRKIARQLSELIAAGEFVPGQALPPERTLAEQLGVSRPSVREALIALEIAGKVVIRVGSGVFVAEPHPPVALTESEEGEGPFELLRARRLIEGETAACAAQEGTDDELAEIAAAVREHARVDSSAPAADRAFHLAIARATHNGPLLAVVQMLWDQGRGAVWKQMEKHFETSALRASTLRDHQKILEAILAHDRRGARAAMHAHLERVEHNFGQSLEPKARAAKKPQRKPKSR